MAKKVVKDIELTREELNDLLEELSEFDHNSFILLAGTDQYEIVPTSLDTGEYLDKEELDLLREECERLGLTILFRIDKTDGETLLVNSITGKTMVLREGMQ